MLVLVFYLVGIPIYLLIRQCEQKNYSKKMQVGGEKDKEPKIGFGNGYHIPVILP